MPLEEAEWNAGFEAGVEYGKRETIAWVQAFVTMGFWAQEANRIDRSYKDLYNGDPNCKHEVLPSPGGGVKCRLCRGWFCY